MMQVSRRSWLAGLACSLSRPWEAVAKEQSPRKRIAFLGTVVRQHSHAQHFLDRHAMGYTWGGQWQMPRFDIASVYIDQFPKDDLARSRLKKYQLTSYPTIEEALTLGTSKLAVDGVVIIGEHGDYPTNDKGQKLYPRFPWFKRVVKIFEASGRSVPVFNDKHLSIDWEECQEMVSDAKRLGFAFLAGSSLPVTRRFPAIDLPIHTPLSESVCVGYGGIDSYDFHGLETAQCMSERRQGGECGIRHVQVLKGESLWDQLTHDSYEPTRRLLVAALTRSHHLPVEGGYPTEPVSFDWARRSLKDSTAYLIEHRDGFRTTMFLAPIRDFNYAGLHAESGEIFSCQMYLPMPNQSATTADFFNPLARHIEAMVLTGEAPYPVERTLLTSGMVIAGVDSIRLGYQRIETPTMDVRYTVKPESHFWRD